MAPEYIHSEETAKLIGRHFKKTKIFVILRNPVDRAFFQHSMYLRHKIINDNKTFL